MERYSRKANQWVEKAPMSDQRFSFGAANNGAGVWVMGGHVLCNDSLTEDCGNRWSPVCLLPSHVRELLSSIAQTENLTCTE